jgi:RNA polymerase sigma factor (sigma-70 family)
MLSGAIEILGDACQGRVRADRVLGISQFNSSEYRAVMAQLPQSIYRLERMASRNRRDAMYLAELDAQACQRRLYSRRLKARCHSAESLVWDVKLRLKAAYQQRVRLYPVWQRMLQLERVILKDDCPAPLQTELAGLIKLTGMRPQSLSRWMALTGALLARYDVLKQRLARHNLRLVVSIAKHYINQEPGLMDAIQEGNAGLLRAIDKFEPIGYRFSTYATWWIKQSISQSLSEHKGIIALPREKAKSISRLQKERTRWIARHGRIPTVDEQLEECGLPISEATLLIGFDRPILSLDMASPGTEGTLGELVADRREANLSGRLDRRAIAS